MAATADSRSIAEEFIVPASHGRGCIVKKGQVLRISLVEGKQVADVSFLNADNPREGFHVGQTLALNMLEGSGNLQRVSKLYSRPPYENVMLTVVDDPVGVHFAWMGGRCSPGIYEVRNRMGIGRHVDAGSHRTCQQNLEEAVAPFGVEPDMVPDVFNVFMVNDDKATFQEGRMVFLPPVADKGDYIDLRAEMNVLAAISACPNDQDAVNDGRPKPLGVSVFDQ
jgi:uncharacterized protein